MAEDITIMISGSGGAGVATMGEILLRASGRQGYFGLLRRVYGPQIRGGECASILRLASVPVMCLRNTVDLMLVLDWQNFSRFEDEVRAHSGTLILADEAAGPAPPGQPADPLPLTSLAKQTGSDRPGMVALGVVGRYLGIEFQHLEDAVGIELADKPLDIRALSIDTLRTGYDSPHGVDLMRRIAPPVPGSAPASARWMVSGNQALACGALQAGLKFVSAYPITPASDVSEWLAGHLEVMGGHLVQAEDEIAAVTMAIGASFGGIPSLTVTSGPGLSLMSEGMGLAVVSETPLVVIDVQRGGPSTGLPTKSEQADLNQAVFGLHGDAPHVVVAPLDVVDCLDVGAWSLCLAEQLQTLVIVLSDQFIGQALTVAEQPSGVIPHAQRQLASGAAPYQRYVDSVDGVSAMAIPGKAGLLYTAEGLEHGPTGLPSVKSSDHVSQLGKRRRKVESAEYGDRWARMTGSGKRVLLCWGSVANAAEEAYRIAGDNADFQVIALRLISPFPVRQLSEALQSVDELVILEQSEGGQFARYVASQISFAGALVCHGRPGPVLVSPEEVTELMNVEHDQ